MSNAANHLYLFFEGGQQMIKIEFLEGGLQLQMKVQIAGVSPRFVKLKHLLPRLHQLIISMYSPRELLELRRVKTKAMVVPPQDQWYDVQDDDGTWRVGYCEKADEKYKLILPDGFHPSHSAFFCDHGGKIMQIRSKTKGLTVPANKTIRRVLNIKELDQLTGKLALFQLQTNQVENTSDNIRIVLRTELLILVDKIFNTPVEVFATIKMADLHINKFCINVIEYYFKLLESSKKFINLLDTNDTAKELFRATYEMAAIIEMILGLHPRSKAFYESQMNRTVTCQGFLDCFIKSQGGILPFRLFLKSVAGLKAIEVQDMSICMETVYLFISMCEKYQKQLLEGKVQSITRIIVEEIINLVKASCDKNPEIRAFLKTKADLLSRVETLYFKLFPNKVCILRKILEGDKDGEKDKQRERQRQKQKDRERERQKQREKMIAELTMEKKSKMQEKQNQKMKQLQKKLQRLQNTLSKLQTIDLHSQPMIIREQRTQQIRQPTENMGEQAFLASLQWALQAGDMATCKKLVTWRRSLLKLGRIAGWEIALSVGMKTFKRKQISSDDIIEANYDFIMKQEAPKA